MRGAAMKTPGTDPAGRLTVTVRFYEELNDYIKPDRRKREITRHLNHRTTTKDIIESFGVPHTEVDLILVDGVSVGFDHHVDHLNRISVYPVFEILDIAPVTLLHKAPLRRIWFVADVHLGKLARRLRLLGLDTLYRNDYEDQEVLDIVQAREERVLLTRDHRLLMHNVVQRGMLIRSHDADEQTTEVLRRFDLFSALDPFTRCLVCNREIEPVDKKDILDRLTRRYYRTFKRCLSCGRVYWQGSHHTQLLEFVRKVNQ